MSSVRVSLNASVTCMTNGQTDQGACSCHAASMCRSFAGRGTMQATTLSQSPTHACAFHPPALSRIRAVLNVRCCHCATQQRPTHLGVQNHVASLDAVFDLIPAESPHYSQCRQVRSLPPALQQLPRVFEARPALHMEKRKLQQQQQHQRAAAGAWSLKQSGDCCCWAASVTCLLASASKPPPPHNQEAKQLRQVLCAAAASVGSATEPRPDD